MLYHTSISPSVFLNEVPRALIARLKIQPITKARGHTFKGPTLLVSSLGTDGFKPPLLNHAHVICQLGSRLDSVDGVEAVFWN
jgi:hypothetical protein